MEKVRMFRCATALTLEKEVNAFASKHNILQISYSVYAVDSMNVYYSCMVLYEDRKEQP